MTWSNGSSEQFPTIPSVFAEAALQLQPTGVSFVDELLGGGVEAHDVIGILGPTGVGKTTLAMQIAVSLARREAAAGSQTKIVYLGFEETESELRSLCFSCAAGVPRMELPLPSFRPSEHQRSALVSAAAMLNSDLTIIRGPSHRIEADTFDVFFAALRDLIAAKLPEAVVGAIVIDPVELACRRFQDPDDFDMKVHRRLSGEFPPLCRRHLALRFSCPVWLVHHLEGKLGNRPSGFVGAHEDSQHGPMFGRELDRSLVFGSQDQQHGGVLLRCTARGRSSTPKRNEQRVLRVTDQGTLIDVTAESFIDRASQRIASRDDATRVVAPDFLLQSMERKDLA
jgi:hypothetical protein